MAKDVAQVAASAKTAATPTAAATAAEHSNGEAEKKELYKFSWRTQCIVYALYTIRCAGYIYCTHTHTHTLVGPFVGQIVVLQFEL